MESLLVIVLELCEAILIMKNEQISIFDERGKKEQISIVVNFFAEIMHFYFKDKTFDDWRLMGENLFENSTLINSFILYLLVRNVSSQNANLLIENPFEFLKLEKIIDIRSNKIGILNYIDQKAIGNIINFGFNKKLKASNPTKAINLSIYKRLGDNIAQNENICSIFSTIKDFTINKDEYSELLSCFHLS